jgi:hypothetical protein
VIADASGNITDSFNLPNSFVSDYDVTATGAQSGTVRTTFTDSQPTSIKVNAPTSNAPAGVTQGGSATYGNVDVTMGGNANTCIVTLGTATLPAQPGQSADTGLPTGATAVFSPNPNTTSNTSYTSTFKVDTLGTTAPGTYTFHVKATKQNPPAGPGTGCNGNLSDVVNSPEQVTLKVNQPLCEGLACGCSGQRRVLRERKLYSSGRHCHLQSVDWRCDPLELRAWARREQYGLQREGSLHPDEWLELLEQ